jgi:hypothetical protein
MTLLASYEFILRDGEVLRGTTLSTEVIAQERQPEFPGSDCDLEGVEVITTTDARFTPKIFLAADVFGPDGEASLLMEDLDGELRDIALLEVREGQVWIVRTEPTLDDRVGVTIANADGKVLFTGIGDVTPVEFTPLREGLKRKRGHVLTFAFSEIYKWRRSSPMQCGHTAGAYRAPSPAVNPDYSAPDGGTK